MNETDEQPNTESADKPPEWAIVEIFGHRKHAGRISEVERFGAKMLRVDVPTSDKPDAEFVSHFYGGASIFGITYTDEVSARRLNKPYADPYRASLPDLSHAESDNQADEPF
jgi:hypothetical protein